MSSKRLIEIMEVISCAPTGHNYDPNLLCQFIKDAEFYLCNECCFGEEFYLTILDDVKPGIEEYDDCKSYLTGALVNYGALVYIALQDVTGVTPDSAPACWEVTDKFNTPKYQELYECHLKELLAFITLHAALISTAVRVETLGVMKNKSDYSESVEDKTILLLKNDLQNRIETRRAFMDKFLVRVNETLGIDNVSLYPLYPANKESLCNSGCNSQIYKDSVNIPFLGSGGKKKKCND